MLKIIELFAGLGTATQALKELEILHEAVAISEIDRFAVEAYTALNGEPNNLGDIAKIKKLPQADLVVYGFPCQDISHAGKGAGIAEGTRSGLLLEVERLLKVARDEGTLPKYLLLENVKALISKKFKPDFERWLEFLASMGYTNYWQVLNTKDYCIPQNRERVFCLSVRGEHRPYTFPPKRELRLRLKDMLDEVVDEKYYLTEKTIRSILSSNFNTRRQSIRDGNDICPTVAARDFKEAKAVWLETGEPRCIEAGTLTSEKFMRMHEHSRRVYSTHGIAPCQPTCCGGNVQTKILDDFYPGRVREFEDTAPTLRAGREGLKVMALRGRNPEDLNAKGNYQQRAEFRDDEVTNTLTQVQKDNLIVEPQVLKRQRTDYGKAVRKAYERHEISAQREMRETVPRDDGLANTLTMQTRDALLYNPYNDSHITDIAPTQTANCGSTTSSAAVLQIEGCTIRKLTETECLRLQGWRDKDIAKIKAAGISKSQIYKLAGNAITCSVLIAIFGELFGADYANILDAWDFRK